MNSLRFPLRLIVFGQCCPRANCNCHRTLHHDELCICRPNTCGCGSAKIPWHLNFGVSGKRCSALGSCAAVRHGESQAGRLTLAPSVAPETQAWTNGTEIKVLGSELARLVGTITHQLAPAKGNRLSVCWKTTEVIALRCNRHCPTGPAGGKAKGMKIRRTFRKAVFPNGYLRKAGSPRPE